MNKIFKQGGGAAIGSRVVVLENGQLKEGTDLRVIRQAYEEGETLFLSIRDANTEAALLPLEGYIGSDNKLVLVGRDFDDNKTYKFTPDDPTQEFEIEDGIDLGGEPMKTVPEFTAEDKGKVLKVNPLGTDTVWAEDEGNEVVANPTLAGTEPALTGLQVGDNKYKIESGSSRTIYNGTYDSTNSTFTFELTYAQQESLIGKCLCFTYRVGGAGFNACPNATFTFPTFGGQAKICAPIYVYCTDFSWQLTKIECYMSASNAGLVATLTVPSGKTLRTESMGNIRLYVL